MPDLKTPRQRNAQQQQRHPLIGPLGVVDIPGVEAEHCQRDGQRQRQPVKDLAVEQSRQKFLDKEQHKQHRHAAKRPAAAGNLVGEDRQRGQPRPVKGTQPVMPQPCPGKKHADEPRAKAVVVAVAEILVAAVEFVGHQRRGKV